MKNGGEDDVMAHEGEQKLVLDNEGGEELRVNERRSIYGVSQT